MGIEREIPPSISLCSFAGNLARVACVEWPLYIVIRIFGTVLGLIFGYWMPWDPAKDAVPLGHLRKWKPAYFIVLAAMYYSGVHFFDLIRAHGLQDPLAEIFFAFVGLCTLVIVSDFVWSRIGESVLLRLKSCRATFARCLADLKKSLCPRIEIE